MRRLLLAVAAAALVLGIAAPAVLAASPGFDRSDRVLMAFNGDITVPAGQTADAVVVTGGTATIQGDVRTLFVFDGHAVLQGARVETVVVTGGTLAIDAGTTVTGDIRTLNTTVTQDPAATVGGTVKTLETDIVSAVAILAPVVLLFMLGLGLVTLVAALALAALGAKQVRTAEVLIGKEPVETFLFGLGGLTVSRSPHRRDVQVDRAPLGLTVLFMVWPAAAFIGYLVAAIWIGDLVLNGGVSPGPAERPYAAAVVGVLVLAMISLVPFVGSDREPVRLRRGPAACLADVPPAVDDPAGRHPAASHSRWAPDHRSLHRDRLGATDRARRPFCSCSQAMIVDDRRALGLVVELVAQAREGPPLDAGHVAEDLRGRGGTRRSSRPCRTSVGSRSRRHRRADALLLAERRGREPGGARS